MNRIQSVAQRIFQLEQTGRKLDVIVLSHKRFAEFRAASDIAFFHGVPVVEGESSYAVEGGLLCHGYPLIHAL